MQNVIKSVMVELIAANGHNRPLDAAHVKTLAQSIKDRGLLEPIWLNRLAKTDDNLVLIAGAHRLAAVKQLGLKTIDARIFEVEPELAEELRIIENVQRKNPSVIEEARAYKALAVRVGSVPTAAALIGKSMHHVARLVSLMQLPEKVLALIEAGDLTAAHGFQIARLGDKSRERMVEFVTKKNEYTKKYPTLDDLTREISRSQERNLKDAFWPLDKQIVIEGKTQICLPACNGCQFNTAAQVGLFPDVEGGRCADAACFDKKRKWAFSQLEEAALKRHPGMKGLGVKNVSAYTNQVAGGAVLLTKELEKSKVIQKAMKETPEKFGVVISKGDRWNHTKPKALIALVDKSLLPKSMREDPHTSSGARVDWERQRFIERTVAQVLMGAVAEEFAFKKMNKYHWVRIANKILPSGSEREKLLEICGVKGKGPLSIEQLALVTFVGTFYNWGGGNIKDLSRWVKDAKKIIKETSTRAAAEYDAAKKKSDGGDDASAEKP